MINFHHTKHYLKIIILRYYLLNARIEKEIENMGINLDNVSKINYILLVSLRNLGLMILLKKKKKGERERDLQPGQEGQISYSRWNFTP